MIRLTDTEQKILELLRDGRNHKRKELLELLEMEDGDRRLLNRYLGNLRSKLKPKYDVVCVFNNRCIQYRLVMQLQVTTNDE